MNPDEQQQGGLLKDLLSPPRRRSRWADYLVNLERERHRALQPEAVGERAKDVLPMLGLEDSDPKPQPVPHVDERPGQEPTALAEVEDDHGHDHDEQATMLDKPNLSLEPESYTSAGPTPSINADTETGSSVADTIAPESTTRSRVAIPDINRLRALVIATSRLTSADGTEQEVIPFTSTPDDPVVRPAQSESMGTTEWRKSASLSESFGRKKERIAARQKESTRKAKPKSTAKTNEAGSTTSSSRHKEGGRGGRGWRAPRPETSPSETRNQRRARLHKGKEKLPAAKEDSRTPAKRGTNTRIGAAESNSPKRKSSNSFAALDVVYIESEPESENESPNAEEAGYEETGGVDLGNDRTIHAGVETSADDGGKGKGRAEPEIPAVTPVTPEVAEKSLVLQAGSVADRQEEEETETTRTSHESVGVKPNRPNRNNRGRKNKKKAKSMDSTEGPVASSCTGEDWEATDTESSLYQDLAATNVPKHAPESISPTVEASTTSDVARNLPWQPSEAQKQVVRDALIKVSKTLQTPSIPSETADYTPTEGDWHIISEVCKIGKGLKERYGGLSTEGELQTMRNLLSQLSIHRGDSDDFPSQPPSNDVASLASDEYCVHQHMHGPDECDLERVNLCTCYGGAEYITIACVTEEEMKYLKLRDAIAQASMTQFGRVTEDSEGTIANLSVKLSADLSDCEVPFRYGTVIKTLDGDFHFRGEERWE